MIEPSTRIPEISWGLELRELKESSMNTGVDSGDWAFLIFNGFEQKREAENLRNKGKGLR